MRIAKSSKVKMLTLAAVVLMAPLAASAQIGQGPAAPAQQGPAAAEQPDWSKMSEAFSKSMTQFMQGWTKAAQTWSSEMPKMMEAMKEQCVNCHTVKDQMYRDLAERYAKNYSDYMKTIEAHRKLGEQPDANKKPQ